MSTSEPLPRTTADPAAVREALRRSAAVLVRHAGGEGTFELKNGTDPVTAADREIDALLGGLLPGPGDGWLSEESEDDRKRLDCDRVWVVDPLDGTRAFLARRPEYATSIGLLVAGAPAFGGIVNPAAGVTVIGGPAHGLLVEGHTELPWPGPDDDRLRVLGSRSEWKRCEWQRWFDGSCRLLPMGSVAYKLALVAAGYADATWTLQPKHEWDVAAGAALVLAVGGEVWLPDGGELTWNRRHPRFTTFAACRRGLRGRVEELLRRPG